MPERPGRRRAQARGASGWLSGLVRDQRVLVTVGLVAIALALALGVLTWQDTVGADQEPTGTADSERVVSRRGGFAVTVPADMTVRRRGRTMNVSGPDKDLVVTVGPGAPGPLPAAHREVLGTVEAGYRRVRLLGNDEAEVDGRPALLTSGTAVNKAAVPIRFVVLSVRARPHSYALVAFAGRDSDPAQVLPRVNAVARGFEVLDRASK